MMEGKAREKGLLEVGGNCVWSISTCKPGYGVTNLRDRSIETYWQSDGPQPHYINMEFLHNTSLESICIYTDYSQDESYTPSNIVIKVGNHFHDLMTVTSLELEEPMGWVTIKLKDSKDRPVKGFVYQVSILANHLNGRDTHIRQIKVYETKAPASDDSITGSQSMFTDKLTPFYTLRQ